MAFIRKESISNQGSLLGNLSSRSTVSEEWKGNMRMRGKNGERVERNVSTYLIVPTRNARNAESGTRARLRLTRWVKGELSPSPAATFWFQHFKFKFEKSHFSIRCFYSLFQRTFWYFMWPNETQIEIGPRWRKMRRCLTDAWHIAEAEGMESNGNFCTCPRATLHERPCLAAVLCQTCR